jgi:signal transduction histidine kinase
MVIPWLEICRKCLIPFCIIVFHSTVFSQKMIDYSNEAVSLNISPSLEVFIDSAGKYKANDILNQKYSFFWSTQQAVPSFSFSSAVVWCRFAVKNTSGKALFLEIAPPILNKVSLFQVMEGNIIDSLQLGSFFPASDKKVFKSNNFIFELKPEAEYFLLRVESKTRIFVKAHLAAYPSMEKKTVTVDFIQGVYAGLIFIIFIYQVFLFLTTRDKTYLFYLFHLINALIYFLYISGFGINFIWVDFPVINSYFLSVMSAGYCLSILFVMNFLDTGKSLPFLHKLLKLFILTLLINAVVDLSGNSDISGRLLNLIGLTVISVILAGAVILIRRGFRPARIFLTAWVLYLTGMAVQTLQSLNVLATNEITSNAIQIGSSLEIILLAIAVGNKILFYKEGKLSAGYRQKILLQDKETLKAGQKEKLEDEFHRQTQLLYQKNRELKQQTREINKKFEEISLQNEKLLEVNELLESKNKLIIKQNDELLKHKFDLEQLILERTRELRDATRQAEEADELKTAFLKNFSHELRTPMNAIAGFSALLLEIDPEDKIYDYYTEIIMRNTDSLLELVDNIIDLSKLQSGELHLKLIRFDPTKMFLAMKDRFQEKLRKERKDFVELIIDLPPSESNRLYLDYNRFYKILAQLVENSIKYTDTGFIRYGYKRFETTNDIEVFVIDSGIGIKKEKLEVVLESFQRVEKERFKFHPGIGLGLSLVKGLVKLMNGSLNIDTISSDNADGKPTGTSIRFIIPGAFVKP